MKKMSVIVAAYNAEKYIDRCLKSVISQRTDVEIIVVNDASTDGTAELINKYKDKLKVINLDKNSGTVAEVRNIGLDNAEGEYLTYLDSDDWYEKGALEKMVHYLERYNPDILKFNYSMVYPNGNIKKPPMITKKLFFADKSEFDKYIYPRFIDGISLNSVCCAVFKKGLLKNVRFSKDYRTAEDAAFSVEAYTKAQNVLFVPDRLYCYYQSGNGLTGVGMSIFNKYKYNFKLSGKMMKYLKCWGMDTLSVKIKTITRPVRLTIDKMKRM